MKNRSEEFGRLLKAGIGSIASCEGKKAPIIEEELGEAAGVSGDTIQRYKSGFLPPDQRTVQILAEAAVRRGFLGREWLQRLLHAARFPSAETLLDQLCPTVPTRPRPPRIYANLPAPTYSQFVMRARAFADVVDGLNQRTAVVLIVGLGGNGKTSLAREVAAACLRDGGSAPRFDAVVWVSDKDRPGTTNLSTVLDEVARTLDYPGLTQLPYETKRHEVEQLLRSQRALLIVDNFETITDDGLLAWLLRLPEPSKAIVTSREYQRAWRSSWPVELRGMTEPEVWALLTERARALKIAPLLGEQHLLEPLLVATGGNPKALTMTMGLVKYERRPLPQIVDDLYAARGELFDDLFARAWALLDEAARRVLRAMPLFPDRAAPDLLASAADVPGFAFDRAVERLIDLALLDVQQRDLFSPPRYTLHPLVRAFAVAKLGAEPVFEAEARARWASALNQQVSAAIARQPYADLELLEENDLTARACLDWAYRTARWELFLEVYNRIASIWSVRGLFDIRLAYSIKAVEASARAGQVRQQIGALAGLARLTTYLGDFAAAQRYADEAQQLWLQTRALPATQHDRTDRAMVITHATRLLYQGQPQEALTLLEQDAATSADAWGANRRQYFIGVALHQLGRDREARAVLLQVLHDTEQIGSARLAGNTANHLVAICVAQGDAAAAQTYLTQSQAIAARVRDHRQYAALQLVSARLHALRGDDRAAQAAFDEAIDRFERLGMRRELSEAREARAQLDAQDTGRRDVVRS